MFDFSKLLYGAIDPNRIAVPESQITNFFNPTGSVINEAYNAAAGGTQGNIIAFTGFVASGLTFLAAGTYTIDLYAADIAWLLNTSTPTDGIICYSATPANHANFIQVLEYGTGATFTEDGISATFTLTSDCYVGVNLKWAIGGSFATGRPVPSDVLPTLLATVMLNNSAGAVIQTAFGTPGTVTTDTTPLTLANDEMAMLFNGHWVDGVFQVGYIYKRWKWSGGMDLVQRMYFYAESYYDNNNLEFASICLIPSSTPGPSTPGAFGAAFSPNTISSTNIYVQSDNAPAMVLGDARGMGGAHGIICTTVPATGHGLTNIHRGSVYSDGVTNWTIARIGQNTGGDPNALFLMPPITGPMDNWTYPAPTVNGTLLTYVSGGNSPPATITITGSPTSVPPYLFPANQNSTIKFVLSGGAIPTSNGVFICNDSWTYFDYDTPNVYDTQNVVFALNGNPVDSPSQYNAASSQLHVSTRHHTDAYGVVVCYYQITALQSYNRNGMWPSQNQGGADMANYSALETFHEFQEGVLPYAPNFPQSGAILDFSTFPNMTSSVDEYWALAANRQPASYYSDNQDHNATLCVHGVQDSGGSWIRSKWCMANDDVTGRSADHTLVPQSYLLSAPNKAYMVTSNIEGNGALAFNEQVPEGTVDLSVGAYGMEHPSLADPTHSYVSFVYPKPGGTLAWRWYTANTLTNYLIPIRPDMVGKRIKLIKGAKTVTILDTVVGASGVHVTTTGPGGFSVILY